MRKKLQDKMFELSYIFELFISIIVGHATVWENLVIVVSIAILFAVRRFLLKRYDMVETPDGLVPEGEKH